MVRIGIGLICQWIVLTRCIDTTSQESSFFQVDVLDVFAKIVLGRLLYTTRIITGTKPDSIDIILEYLFFADGLLRNQRQVDFLYF